MVNKIRITLPELKPSPYSNRLEKEWDELEKMGLFKSEGIPTKKINLKKIFKKTSEPAKLVFEESKLVDDDTPLMNIEKNIEKTVLGTDKRKLSNKELIELYKVREAPTIIAINDNGKEVCRLKGFQGEGSLLEWLRHPTCETEIVPTIPEPGNTTPVRDNGTFICPVPKPKDWQPDTCRLKDRNLPFGYRFNKTYCSPENNTFIPQRKGGEYCDNNFECSTNLCADSQCIESGIIKKAMAWLSRFF